MPKLTFHGHATFSIECEDGTKLVIDPYFADNPACDHDGSTVEADFILVTHGHGDHVGDLIPLAERTGATIIATYEIATYMEARGHSASPHHIGGAVDYPFGRVKMVSAVHGGKVDLPDAGDFTTIPAGFLIDFASGTRFHHAGDTALHMDMKLLEGAVDVSALPIGDRFTMGPDDAVRAVDFIKPDVVIPVHYDTWPPIEQDGAAFAEKVGGRARVEVMKPGDTLEI